MVMIEGRCPTCGWHAFRLLGQNWCEACPENRLPIEERERRAHATLYMADPMFAESLMMDIPTDRDVIKKEGNK